MITQPDLILSQIPLIEIINHIRLVVKEEIEASKASQLEEKLLSVKETCKLFHPAISRQTLDAISRQNGTLKKYYLGGKIFFKYSEVIASLKTFKRYSSKKD